MGYILDRIKALIQNTSDAADDVVAIGYGDPTGAQIYFEGVGWFDRGKAWSKDRGLDVGLLDLLLEYGVVSEMERAPEQFVSANIGGSGTNPTILQSDGVSLVTKNETGIPPAGTCTDVTITFDHAYIDNNYAVSVQFTGAAVIPVINSQGTNTLNISAVLPTGGAVNLNSGIIYVMLKGNI